MGEAFTTRELLTESTLLQQKIVEHFSKRGRVEAVNLQQNSVVVVVLRRSFWGLVSPYVASKSFIITAPNI